MIGEIITDGKKLWINCEDGCILRVNCMDILKDDMKPVTVNIHSNDNMTNVTGVK